MKLKKDLNSEINWRSYKMKRNFIPILLLISFLIYSFLAYVFLKEFVPGSNIDRITFLVGILSFVAAIYIILMFARYFR